MLTGYKINGKEIAIEENISDEYKITVPKYKKDKQSLKGAYYISHKGMGIAFRDKSKYVDSDNKLSSLAQQGTVTKGGAPDISLKPGEYNIHLDNNGKLTVADAYYDFGNPVEYCKVWASACAGGGGGASSEGEGGSGSGYALFPIIIKKGNYVHVFVGDGGSGGDYGVEDSPGKDGQDTVFCSGDHFDSSKIFAYIERGHGGHTQGRTVGQDRAKRGDAFLFTGKIENLQAGTYTGTNINIICPDDYTDLTGNSNSDIQNYTNSNNNYTINKTATTLVCCGGYGGDGNNDTAANGDKIEINTDYGNNKVDYVLAYNKSSWTNRGGGGSEKGSDKSSGGGASAFPNSYGGNGGDADPLTINQSLCNGFSGAYGGGGGSGTYKLLIGPIVSTFHFAGGGGGRGQVDLWYKPIGSTVVDNYPSGKDVSDEITVNILSDPQSFQVTSSTIPSDKNINIDIVFIVTNMETGRTGSSRDHGGPYGTLTNKSLGFTYTMTDKETSYWKYSSVKSITATIT